MVKTIKIIIIGKVQNVFFRIFVKKHADKLGIKGFTRNFPNGSIKIIAQGKNDSLDKLIKQVKIGPDFAKVDKIIVSIETSNEIFQNFEIRY